MAYWHKLANWFDNAGVRPKFPGRPVRTIEELDTILIEVQRARDTSPQAFAAALETFWLDPETPRHHPHSPEYRAWQMELYRSLAGKDYSTANERHHFDLESHVQTPYPYMADSGTVGQQLMAIGYIIQAMQLPRGARVLELGLGWGNLALQLAAMGVHVKGLDIETNYAEIVRRRAERLGLGIEVQLGEFFEIEKMQERFDAVIFYEAFHHCDDHLRLIDAIHGILAPGGKFVLAGEPIESRLPYPWGINCSGIALWSIRQHGWLELAFREEYLLETLSLHGFHTVKHDCPVSAAGITYVAQVRA